MLTSGCQPREIVESVGGISPHVQGAQRINRPLHRGEHDAQEWPLLRVFRVTQAIASKARPKRVLGMFWEPWLMTFMRQLLHVKTPTGVLKPLDLSMPYDKAKG